MIFEKLTVSRQMSTVAIQPGTPAAHNVCSSSLSRYRLTPLRPPCHKAHNV